MVVFADAPGAPSGFLLGDTVPYSSLFLRELNIFLLLGGTSGSDEKDASLMSSFLSRPLRRGLSTVGPYMQPQTQ